MGNTIYLAGLRSNILSQSTITISPSENASFPATSLFNGAPGSVFRFSSASSDCSIALNPNLVVNGDFEDTTTPFPVGWTDISSGSASLVQATSKIIHGSMALKLDPGTSGAAAARQDIEMLPGENFTVDARLRSDGVRITRVFVQNLQTGNYLSTTGAWVSPSTTWFVSRTPSSWSTGNPTQATVESYSAVGYKSKTTLRMEIQLLPNGLAYADKIYLWPHTDFISIHGHNIDPRITVKLQHDTTSAFTSATTAAEPTIIQPAFYSKLSSSITDKHIRILFAGNPSSAIEIGELWLGQYQTLSEPPVYGMGVPTEMPVDEHFNVSGQVMRNARAYYPSESVEMKFLATETRKDELVQMLHRGNWGTEPTVVVPQDNEDKVYLGAMTPGLSGTRPLKTLYDFNSISLRGFPFTKRIA
jgi:hypothetical protein